MKTWSVMGIAACAALWSMADVQFFVTAADKSKLFEASALPLKDRKVQQVADGAIVYPIDPARRFQTIDGFGPAVTGSSCYNLLKMKPEERAKLLKHCFSVKDGMGWSYIRVSIGCSDFSLDEYTYCDKPGIENFALTKYETDELFPILREILAINPKVKILASPWTCPKWMKVKDLKTLEPIDSWTGGHLNPKYYQDYATYFVKYVQAMEKAGFPLDTITIQNEPLNHLNSASLVMGWDEQRDFIKQALGPAFKKANIKTKILVFDHNYNYDKIEAQQDYVLKLYADKDAAKYVEGSAWHAYMGNKDELFRIQKGAPDKGIYFTEYSSGKWSYPFAKDLMWSIRELGIGTVNRWCKNVIVWNYVLDEKHRPFRPKGCSTGIGVVQIDSSNYSDYTYESHYYILSHLSKAMEQGSVRVFAPESVTPGVYGTVAINPDGSFGAVFSNENDEPKELTVVDGKNTFTCTLPPKSIATARWKD